MFHVGRSMFDVHSYRENTSRTPPGLSRRLVAAGTDACVLIVISGFLLCYLEPQFLFSKTTPTGGDMGSHYFTAEYLRNHLLPQWKISGWCQGNLAGFPMLQYYFPLPFLLMSALSLAVPLEIAFKLVAVLGTFLLPLCTYGFLRLLGRGFPIPALGAAFTLPFLFMEGNSMWGGNIASTLAGEITYSLGFALTILWLGMLHRTMERGRGALACSVVLGCVAMSHGYTLLFAGFASLFFLFTRMGFRKNLLLLARVHGGAVLLTGFWLVPLLAFLPFTTRFSILWIFFDFNQVMREVLPLVVRPYLGLALAGVIGAVALRFSGRRAVVGREFVYIWWIGLCAVGLYFAGYRAGVVDIRFLPFAQWAGCIAAVSIFGIIRLPDAARPFLAVLLLAGTMLWVDSRETSLRSWARHDFRGFEKARLYNDFSSVNRFLKGGPGDPRVAYEHSMRHQGAGTVRAFENLPLFSGRSTLEGVYIQASLSVPFLFYMQSEYSRTPSTPIPDYNYSRFDLDRAARHMEMFNVGHFIAVEPETVSAADAHPSFHPVHESGPYRVYELASGSAGYVEPVRYMPVAAGRDKWRRTAYEWFRVGDLDVPLVFDSRRDRVEAGVFSAMEPLDVRNIPKRAIQTHGPSRQTVTDDEILIEGAAVGKPLMVKISYHPNWKVEGADRVYPASPAFMLLVPDGPTVRLYYGRSWPDHLGALLTVMFVLGTAAFGFAPARRLVEPYYLLMERVAFPAVVASMLSLFGVCAWYLAVKAPEFPVIPFNRGIAHFTAGEFPEARKLFGYVRERHPQTLIVDEAVYHLAMSHFREKNWREALREIERLLDEYPETRRAAEALFHAGLCASELGREQVAHHWFKRTIDKFPGSVWAGLAAERLRR